MRKTVKIGPQNKSDDIWGQINKARLKFMEDSYGKPPGFVFIGYKQKRELYASIYRNPLYSHPLSMSIDKKAVMGMELLVVDREDFMKVTA